MAGPRDEARAAFQWAERRPAAAVLIEMAREHHLAPRRLVNLGDLAFGSPLAPGVQERCPRGIKAAEHVARGGATDGVDGLHQRFFLCQHAEFIGRRGQGDGDGEGAVRIGLDFGFHASVVQVRSTKVQI